MRYWDLSIPGRSLIILGLFLEVCISGYLLYNTFRRSSLRQKSAQEKHPQAKP